MSSPLSSEEGSCLYPVDTLRELCFAEQESDPTAEGLFSEFRLQASGQTIRHLQHLVALLEQDSTTSGRRCIWIADRGFITNAVDTIESQQHEITIPAAYSCPKFRLTLRHPASSCSEDVSSSHRPSSRASTVEFRAATRSQALATLEFVLSLQDDYFTSLTFQQKPGLLPTVCLLENPHLVSMISHPKRQTRFDSISFSPAQCRVLARNAHYLIFRNCPFQDGGVAFREAFFFDGEQQHQHPFTLQLEKEVPFDSHNWIQFLDQTRDSNRGLERLELVDRDYLFVESCRSLAVANVGVLGLHHCRMRDTRTLVEAIRTGRGPRGLETSGFARWPSPFGRSTGWVHFLRALGCEHCNLQHLSMESLPTSSNAVLHALVHAIRDNKSLLHFGLRRFKLRRRVWKDLLEAISRHPTLRTLELPKFQDPDVLESNQGHVKKERTKEVIGMLSLNDRVEAINVWDNFYECSDWEATVLPTLECNRYRRLFASIPRTDASRRAILGAALGSVRKKPTLLWMLLSQNQDMIV